jgi:two-component system phosphate regulon sensor histidine kinase PhoR
LQNIKNTQKPLLERSNASIEINVLPETLSADIDKLHFENVFQNLLDNAVKYNDKAAPVIKINAWKEDGHIMIQVADNGKGIPAAYIDKVFDKFFRVPAGDLHDVKGYGLGLSYVQAIVQLHYGTITVESVQGSGTTFTIKMSV